MARTTAPLPTLCPDHEPDRTTLLFSESSFVFLTLASTPGHLQELPHDAPDPSRQRKGHRKSRTGCLNCRKRRVKCDEGVPSCSTCARRGEFCQRRDRSTMSSRPGRVDESIRPCPSPASAGPVNFLHMKLFHHFETSTKHSLVFGLSVWDHALRLSCQVETLMHAILCISARHLSYLCPGEDMYPAAAATHLSRTVQGFRKDLGLGILPSNMDAFMATAVLLHYELWDKSDFAARRDGTLAIDPGSDLFFDLCTGLRGIFLNCIGHMSQVSSVFGPAVAHSPRVVLAKVANINRSTLHSFQSFFAYHRTLDPRQLVPPAYSRGGEVPPQDCWGPHRRIFTIDDKDGEETEDMDEESYNDVIPRLCLLLSFLPEASAVGDAKCSTALIEGLLPDLSRFIFTFPVLCDSNFARMVKRGDQKALVLMYHFYRAVRILLSGKREYWWAEKRSSLSEISLKDYLLKECARTTEGY